MKAYAIKAPNGEILLSSLSQHIRPAEAWGEGHTCVPVEVTERAEKRAAISAEALIALKGAQQADADGVMVRVSRQALDEAIAVLSTSQARICRADGRCQYAIDHGAEGMGHCPEGECCMPAQPKEGA